MKQRSAGILCPIFSLPGPYGIGQMGAAAYQFVDYLSEAGFSYWQILPLNPIDSTNSPYSSVSAFAGYPAFIDFEELVKDGLLFADELPLKSKPDRVHYEIVENNFKPVFEILFHEFTARAHENLIAEFKKFTDENSSWLDVFCIFASLKKEYNGAAWNTWPEAFRNYTAINKDDLLKFEKQIRFEKLIQFLFFRQWISLKTYANNKGIAIIGDMPIYVSYDSADVWSHPDLFKLDRKLQPKEVAGVPPDFFAEDGQLWGFPIYHWKNHQKEDYKWWKERTSHLLQVYDHVRFDHFRAVESYYSVPAKDENARNGKWVKAPGKALLKELTSLKKDGLIAENLGDISEEVEHLRKMYQIPGMKIFQFAFGGHIHSEHLPHNCDTNDIYYSGTHDNDVLGHWLKTTSDAAISHLVAYYGINRKILSTRWLVDRILSSSPRIVMLPIQDFLELGDGSRINIPGTVSEWNWSWRLKKADFNINKASDTAYRLDFFGRKRYD
jgi:4-alpha-glucanotransferase